MPFWLVFGVAVLLRITFAFKSPELSNDIYRYLWDGILFNNGINPYAFTPINIYNNFPEYIDLFHKLDHNNFFTIYPPVSQLFFRISTYISTTELFMKIFFAVLDSITCIFIYDILKSLHKPALYSLIYFFNPLVVIEISGSGHIDGLGIFFLAFSMFLLSKYILSDKKQLDFAFSKKNVFIVSTLSILFSFAVLTKLFPLVFLPLFLFILPVQLFLLFFLIFMLTIVIMIAVFYPNILNILITLTIYTANWEFSNILFKLLHAVFNSSVIPRAILTIFFICCMILIYKRFLPLLLNHSLNAFITVCYYISFAFIVFSPTLHSWYGLYMMLFLPFVMRMEGIIFSFSLLLTYRVMSLYISDRIWFDDWFTAFLVLAGPISALCLGLLCRHILRLFTSKAIFQGK